MPLISDIIEKRTIYVAAEGYDFIIDHLELKDNDIVNSIYKNREFWLTAKMNKEDVYGIYCKQEIEELSKEDFKELLDRHRSLRIYE